MALLLIIPANITWERFCRLWIPIMSLRNVEVRLQNVPENERSDEYKRLLDFKFPNGDPVIRLA